MTRRLEARGGPMPRKQLSSAIQWDLLAPVEAEFLREVGITLHASALEFTRSLTWSQFTLAFAYIYALKRRSPRRGTHVNFAVGDCLVAGEKLFGKSTVKQWLKEFLRIVRLRDMTLNMAGGLLILLQQLEEHIRLCCTALPGAPLLMEEFFSGDPSKRRQTLGQLAQLLKQSAVFTPKFEDRLTRFVSLRNRFVHHLWIEEWKKTPSASPIPSLAEHEAIHLALQSLAREAFYFDRVFQGFRYELLTAIRGKPLDFEEDPTPADRWVRYVKEFRGALRNSAPPDDEFYVT